MLLIQETKCRREGGGRKPEALRENALHPTTIPPTFSPPILSRSRPYQTSVSLLPRRRVLSAPDRGLREALLPGRSATTSTITQGIVIEVKVNFMIVEGVVWGFLFCLDCLFLAFLCVGGGGGGRTFGRSFVRESERLSKGP